MRYALVTGAASGIGKEITDKLSSEGWFVFAGVKNLGAIDSAITGGTNIQYLQLDVTSSAEISRCFDVVADIVGDADEFVLVNNAGVAYPAPLTMMPEEDFIDHINVNLVGGFLMTRKFYPLVKKASSAKIIFIGSISGYISVPFYGAYSASKAGLIAMVHSLRRELALDGGVKVVLVDPHTYKTALFDKSRKKLEQLGGNCEEEHRKLYGLLKVRFEEESTRGFSEPLAVAEKVLQICNSNNPRAIYRVGFRARTSIFLGGLISHFVLDKLVLVRYWLLKRRG
jgi:NAD(P)-dependent dehydrogenase (short-subunit alcohol dehydrogenase family)